MHGHKGAIWKALSGKFSDVSKALALCCNATDRGCFCCYCLLSGDHWNKENGSEVSKAVVFMNKLSLFKFST